ncbi:serine hydrolase [Streptomyces sp. NPDC047014]|uniref:serine hydrolase n=1 Tax=Streptomyces sp. NPDC047014 TaxID=3155736 RepID=UPI0033ED237E
MTLLSDQAETVRTLVESTDPGAVWAAGGPEGAEAGSPGPDPGAVSGSPGSDPDAPALDVDGLAAVLALWPVVGSLVDEGVLSLHTPLAAYGEPVAADAPAGTTAHHLLTRPGGAAALTRLVERLTGSPLAELADVRVWRPLGMSGTRFDSGRLHAPLADLIRFLTRLLHPDGTADGPSPLTHAWTAESLRIRTGELTPARGLLWQPAPHGVWTHHGPTDPGPALWVSPRHGRWAVLLPSGAAPDGPLRSAFREAVFAAPAVVPRV